MATVILKVTEKCNSNCIYCDVVLKAKTGRSMPLDILETVFFRINEYLLDYPEEEIQLIWHGGEPLLVGPKYYAKAIEFQDRRCSKTKTRIKHSIQTNLTCFRENFLSLFKKLGILTVGTSYDPLPHIRGWGREINSAEYNKKFMENLKVLERNGIGWGLIYVVTKRTLEKPLDVFFYLTNLLLSGGINFNPVLIYDDERKDIAISPMEYVEFLASIFPYWWQNKHRFPDVEPFKSLVANIIEGQTRLGCVDSGSCTYHHINIAPDGESSQCGRSDDWGLLQYGNIQELSFSEIIGNSQRYQLEERVERLKNNDCKGCRFWNLCHGGCPLDAYSKHKSFMYKSEWCQSKKVFIEKYFEPITGVRYEPAPN